MRKIILMLFIAVIISTVVIAADSSDTEVCDEGFDVHLFYSSTCPHCKNEIAFLKDLEAQYPKIIIHYIEVSANNDMFKEFAEKFQTSTAGVPRTFVNGKVFVGFSKEPGDYEYNEGYKAFIGYQNLIKQEIFDVFNITGTTTDPIDTDDNNHLWILLSIPLYLLSYPLFRNKLKRNPTFKRHWIAGLVAVSIIAIFAVFVLTPDTIIKNYASSLPFPLFVFIVALADGFNPCAFTVLIILLSLLTYTKDKKSMMTIGLTFIITSAIMYFIFISVMILVGSWAIQQYGPIIMMILGTVILFAGIINLKDFFFFNKGVSLSISESNKSKITHKASKIVRQLKESKTAWAFMIALGGTVLLAVFVNLVELGCTAILPAIYMVSLVNTFKDNIAMQLLWTAFYAIVYILPLFAILFNFIYTFKSTRLTEKQGRILKLISGLFMLLFGAIMLFMPELLMFA